MSALTLEIIGTVHSCFKEKYGTPRQSQLVEHARGYIKFDSTWEPQKALRGLEGFSHLWVLFYFHANKNLYYSPVVTPPRYDRKIGTFASRSPLRPNPIGLSLVRIESVAKDRVYISGVDIIDGTPVLDIKPYIHDYDSVEGSKNGWLENLAINKLEVTFSDEALRDLAGFGRENLQQSITDILKCDIRSRNDKTAKNKERVFGFCYEDLNVRFVHAENQVTVVRVEVFEAQMKQKVRSGKGLI